VKNNQEVVGISDGKNKIVENKVKQGKSEIKTL